MNFGTEAQGKLVLRFIGLVRSGENMRGLSLGESISAVLKSLKHSDPEVRRSAAAALENFGAEAASAIPTLTQSLDDPDLMTQVAATRALGGIGSAAVPALAQALTHSKKQVRREAIWALGRIGPPAQPALPALTRALRDSDLRVRLGAAQALGSFGPEAQDAIPALIEALHDTNLVFCRLAAQALTRIGSAALPALQQASQCPDAFVRREASWALQHLGQSTSPIGDDQGKEKSDISTWVRETHSLREPGPQATVQIPLRPKKIQQTTKFPLS